VIGLLLGAGATYVLAGQSQTRTETLTSTSTMVDTSASTFTRNVTRTSTVTRNVTVTSTKVEVLSQSAAASTTDPSLGLRLTLTINETFLTVGQNLSMGVDIFNTLPANNTLPASAGETPDSFYYSVYPGNWTLEGFPMGFWGGCITAEPAGFALLQGNYTLSQLLAMNGNWTTGGQGGGACSGAGWAQKVTFQPMSDNASAVGENALGANFLSDSTLYTGPLAVNFPVGGYYSYPVTIGACLEGIREQVGNQIPEEQDEKIPPVGSAPFVPGVYTIAAADEWGQTVVLHFTVMASGT
jgi:hypothetical protein